MTITPESEVPEGAPKRSEPENFRGRKLSVALTVNDVRTSVEWYRDVVGFYVDKEYEEDGKLWGARVVAGTVEIFLNQDDGAKGWDREKGVGLSLQIETIQDIDKLAERIRSNGGELVMEPQDMDWGPRLFRVRDPDGFLFSIMAAE